MGYLIVLEQHQKDIGFHWTNFVTLSGYNQLISKMKPLGSRTLNKQL